MLELLRTKMGRLRLVGALEGISLIALIFIAMPIKYGLGNPLWVESIGPVHGILFLLFVLATFSVAIEQAWKFWSITWKVLLACLIPFGTFYVDYKILRRLPQD